MSEREKDIFEALAGKSADSRTHKKNKNTRARAFHEGALLRGILIDNA